MFLYIVIPFLGAILAAVLYIYHNSLEKEDRSERRLPPTDLQKRRENHKAEV
jgi:phosphate/sulfate permease